jgi:uncharacterized protein (UPF0335 family)
VRAQGDIGVIGKGTEAGAQLRAFIERIERLLEEKKTIGDDVKAVFAEAKASSFDTRTMRNVIKLRKLDVEERQATLTLLDTYLHAIGMEEKSPLTIAIGVAGIDIAAREQAVEFLKGIVPAGAEIILKIGGAPLRIWRDDSGTARAEEVTEIEAKPRPGKSVGKKKRKDHLTVVKLDEHRGPDPVKDAADRAEERAERLAQGLPPLDDDNPSAD